MLRAGALIEDKEEGIFREQDSVGEKRKVVLRAGRGGSAGS